MTPKEASDEYIRLEKVYNELGKKNEYIDGECQRDDT
nr:MAG TPA: hypothetical protein [Caudoviricetes sp.]